MAGMGAMDSRRVVLLAALALACFAVGAHGVASVIYVNRFLPSQLDLLVGPGNAYTHIIFTFYTKAYGPVDTALHWATNNLGSDPRIAAARARGVKFLVSCGGATEIPFHGHSGAEYGRDFAQFAKDNGFDGIDFDVEGFAQGDDGKGTAWLVEATKEASRVFPGAIITHAPQAPYFTSDRRNGWSAMYVDVEKQVGHLIDFYNIQFYNQVESKYETYETLFEHADGYSVGTSVMEIANQGVSLSKIVVGKPVTRAGATNTGHVEMNVLAQIFRTAASKGTLPRGFMGWQWILDVESLGGNWAQTLSTAWSGAPPPPTTPPPVTSSPPPPAPTGPVDPGPAPTRPPPVGVPAFGSCAASHTVQEGDSLLDIGLQYQVAPEYIAQANGIEDMNKIYVGETLKIPPCVLLDSAPAPGGGEDNDGLPDPDDYQCEHLVGQGDNAYQVGEKYGVPWQDIFKANSDRLTIESQVITGHYLRVPCNRGPDSGQDPLPGPADPAASPVDAVPSPVDPTPAPIDPATPSGGMDCDHLVQAGESVYVLADMYGASWEDIFTANWNKYTDPSQVIEGHTVKVPCSGVTGPADPVPTTVDPAYPTPSPADPTPAPVDPTTPGGDMGCVEEHVVQPGETVFVLGEKYGIPWNDIFQANRDRINDPSQVVVGHTLRLPCGVQDLSVQSEPSTPARPKNPFLGRRDPWGQGSGPWGQVNDPWGYVDQPTGPVDDPWGYVDQPTGPVDYPTQPQDYTAGPADQPTGPVGSAGTDCTKEHLVGPEDSIYVLGDLYGVDPEVIFNANRNIINDRTQIPRGFTMKIPLCG